ncbi:MAG: NAD(P)/FAD-dependent oxidoreductase [Ruminococcaceae bacterium]|nr:NAD(P)/FAD-dependent oxidoreductase [Oscillospiraceae bacterium]
MKTYDIVIIGGGTAGIFTAYELNKLKPDARIAIIEQGNVIRKRICPIVDGKVKTCINCKNCSIMNGFGGAGAFSDGKFNFTTEFGGWLNDYLPDNEVMDLIEYVDSINILFGATTERFSTYSEAAKKLEKKALEHDLHLLQASVKHLGTEKNLDILTNIYDYLQDKIDILCNTTVEHIIKTSSGEYELVINGASDVKCQYLVAAPGRSGAEWFSSECRNLGIDLVNNQVDIGVRVELPAKVFEEITNVVYEAKLVYRTKQYGDHVRTFCMNPNGHVVMENVDGLITVNGHSYSEASLQSQNTNFALLVSNRFTQPFNQPYQYGKRIASLSNMLAGGVLVQRFGDLVKGVRTNEHRMSKSFTKPTLNATPGDLSLVLPKRHLDNIIEMIYALDKIAPGTANYDTLLYGVEVKFYSSRIVLSNLLETEHTNMFACGDGAGITRGLSQAAASGVHVARTIYARMSKM